MQFLCVYRCVLQLDLIVAIEAALTLAHPSQATWLLDTAALTLSITPVQL